MRLDVGPAPVRAYIKEPGQCASRLVPLTEFIVSVRSQAEKFARLDGLSLEDLAGDVHAVGEQVWACIESL